MDNFIYFDIDRSNNAGKNPIFLAVEHDNEKMLKFLLQNGCNITLKDYRGETVKDSVYRYLTPDSKLLKIYTKYENRILVNAIFSEEPSFKECMI